MSVSMWLSALLLLSMLERSEPTFAVLVFNKETFSLVIQNNIFLYSQGKSQKPDKKMLTAFGCCAELRMIPVQVQVGATLVVDLMICPHLVWSALGPLQRRHGFSLKICGLYLTLGRSDNIPTPITFGYFPNRNLTPLSFQFVGHSIFKTAISAMIGYFVNGTWMLL